MVLKGVKEWILLIIPTLRVWGLIQFHSMAHIFIPTQAPIRRMVLLEAAPSAQMEKSTPCAQVTHNLNSLMVT